MQFFFHLVLAYIYGFPLYRNVSVSENSILQIWYILLFTFLHGHYLPLIRTVFFNNFHINTLFNDPIWHWRNLKCKWWKNPDNRYNLSNANVSYCVRAKTYMMYMNLWCVCMLAHTKGAMTHCTLFHIGSHMFTLSAFDDISYDSKFVSRIVQVHFFIALTVLIDISVSILL